MIPVLISLLATSPGWSDRAPRYTSRYSPCAINCWCCNGRGRDVYGAETRSASRRTLILVNKPAETVAPCYLRRLRARPTADRWPPMVGRTSTVSRPAGGANEAAWRASRERLTTSRGAASVRPSQRTIGRPPEAAAASRAGGAPPAHGARPRFQVPCTLPIGTGEGSAADHGGTRRTRSIGARRLRGVQAPYSARSEFLHPTPSPSRRVRFESRHRRFAGRIFRGRRCVVGMKGDFIHGSGQPDRPPPPRLKHRE